MGFFDKAMKTANELAGKAETALAQSGLNVPGTPGAEAAKIHQELGQMVHAEHRGEPADPARRSELLQRLDTLAEQIEQAATAPPPPGSTAPPSPGPGAAGPGSTAPPSPGPGAAGPGSTPPPPPGPGAAGPGSAPPPPPGPGAAGPGSTPPPPPPSG